MFHVWVDSSLKTISFRVTFLLWLMSFWSEVNNIRESGRRQWIMWPWGVWNPASGVWLWVPPPFKLTRTAIGSKAIGSWSAAVTALTDHVRFTETLAPHWVTLTAQGALGITAAGCKQHRQRELELQLGRWRCARSLPRAPPWMMEEMLQRRVEHTSARAGIGVIRKESTHMYPSMSSRRCCASTSLPWKPGSSVYLGMRTSYWVKEAKLKVKAWICWSGGA